MWWDGRVSPTARRADPPAADAGALPGLPATAWAVLGLLSFDRELSGYDVKQWADAILHFFYWSPATSQIYAELRRLEGLGLATSRVVARDDVRAKRVYRITPEGRAALERWQLETDAEAPVLKHGLLLRVWLGHLAPPERLREQVEAHREQLRAELAEAERSATQAARQPEWAYPALVARWTCRRIESELALADEMLADLDELTVDATEST
jgi:DNA-binding PadR family transcriptional regulator